MPEDPTQVAGSFIDALRSQPLSLALVAMNIGLLGFLYYSAVVATQERHLEMQLMYENRTAVAKMLAECYPAPR
jgi:hypothetical protein